MIKLIPFIVFSFCFSYYDIGDTISIADQEMPHEICYGEYVNDMYMIADANYLINGGNKQITIMKLSAAW